MERKMIVTTGIAACICGLTGIIAPSMYGGLVLSDLYYAMVAQDVHALVAGMVLAVLGWRSRFETHRSRFWAIGLLAFLAYAYGIYAFEMVYTFMYFGYIAVLGLSVWTLVALLVHWSSSPLAPVSLPRSLAIAGGIWHLLMALMFTALWISQLIPLISQGGRLTNFFSIYVIDLAFAVPALVLSAIALLRRSTWSVLAGPSLSVLGLGILSPLVFGELVKSIETNHPLSETEFSFYLPIVVGFAILLGAYQRGLSPEKPSDSP